MSTVSGLPACPDDPLGIMPGAGIPLRGTAAAVHNCVWVSSVSAGGWLTSDVSHPQALLDSVGWEAQAAPAQTPDPERGREKGDSLRRRRRCPLQPRLVGCPPPPKVSSNSASLGSPVQQLSRRYKGCVCTANPC
jgi:hypothetical protein